MILSSIPSIRVWPFLISSGSKLPSRSRGNGGISPSAWRFAAARHSLVAFPGGGVGLRLIAEVRGQFAAQHPFHQPDLQLLHQPGVAKQIFRPLSALQKFVQQFVGNRHRPCSSQEAWTSSAIHRRSDTLGVDDSDLAKATKLAVSLDTKLGIGALGPVWIDGPDSSFLLEPAFQLRVRHRIEAAEDRATAILNQHRMLLTDMAKVLLQKRELSGEDLSTWLTQINQPSSAMVPS